MPVDFNCPFCGQQKVVCDDCIDTYNNGNDFISSFVGHCTNCGKEVQYEEYYAFIKYQNIRLG